MFYSLVMMTVEEVLPYFDGKKVNLANALGLTKQAVSNWGDGEIPKEFRLELQYEILPPLKRKAAREAKKLASHGQQ